MSENNTVEVQSDLGEEIVRSEFDKRSDEGSAKHSRNTAQADAEASKTSKTSDYDDDAAFHEAFQEAIESTKPLLSDKDRIAQEDREQAQRDREEQAEAEAEAEEEADEEFEEQKGPNPLDQFAPDAVKQFADHFGLTEEDLENPAVQKMLASRMSDVQEQTNRIQAPIAQVQDEQRFTQHLEELAKLAADPSINDPRMVKAFTGALAQCFDAQTPEAQQSVENLSSAMIQGGLSLMSTVVPQIIAHYLPSYIEQYLPGLAESHRDATVHNIWADVRASDPSFRGLPDVDSEEFEELRGKVLAANPWMETIQFKDGNGQPLHPAHPQAVRQQAALFARLARGEQFTPEMVKKAVEAGRREAQGHSRKVSVSRSMRSGKSAGAFQRPESNDFKDAIEAYNKSQRSTEF